MMVSVNRPCECVHHIFVRKPRHEFHEPECGNDPKYVDEDLQLEALNSKCQNSKMRSVDEVYRVDKVDEKFFIS